MTNNVQYALPTLKDTVKLNYELSKSIICNDYKNFIKCLDDLRLILYPKDSICTNSDKKTVEDICSFALHQAVVYNRLLYTHDILVNFEIAYNTCTKLNEVLSFACKLGYADIIDILIKYGADKCNYCNKNIAEHDENITYNKMANMKI